MRDCLFHPDTIIEWGANQPFKTVKMADAIKEKSLPFSGAGTIEKPLLEALTSGNKPQEIPADSGCDAELIGRFLDYIAKPKSKQQGTHAKLGAKNGVTSPRHVAQRLIFLVAVMMASATSPHQHIL
jgi:hypothetical protein